MVNAGFIIIVFSKEYGHWQIGNEEDTIYAGFISFKNDELYSISEDGSESLNMYSIMSARLADIELFKDSIRSMNFEVIYRSIVVNVNEVVGRL